MNFLISPAYDILDNCIKDQWFYLERDFYEIVEIRNIMIYFNYLNSFFSILSLYFIGYNIINVLYIVGDIDIK